MQGAEFRERRDEAIVRLMAETGLRAAEVSLTVADVQPLKAGAVAVHRGKGGKGRRSRSATQTAAR